LIGTYDPKKTGENFTLKLGPRRIWLSVGAQAVGHREEHHQKVRKSSAETAKAYSRANVTPS